MSNKLIFATVIITFWLVFPFFIMFMNLNNFEELKSITIDEQKVPSATIDTESSTVSVVFGTVKTQLKIVGLYFQILLIGIPDVSLMINIFVTVIKVITLLVGYLLIRGN